MKYQCHASIQYHKLNGNYPWGMSRSSKIRIQTSRYLGTSVPCSSLRPTPPRHETTCQLLETWAKFKTIISFNCIIIYCMDIVGIYAFNFLNDSRFMQSLTYPFTRASRTHLRPKESEMRSI